MKNFTLFVRVFLAILLLASPISLFSDNNGVFLGDKNDNPDSLFEKDASAPETGSFSLNSETLKLVEHLLGASALTDEEQPFYDINQDGIIDVADIISLQIYNYFPRFFVCSSPPVSLILPGTGDDAELAMNIFAASPPVSIVLTGISDPGGLALNVLAASPPVSILLTGSGEEGGVPMNTVIGAPPVSVVLTGIGEEGDVPMNTILAKPPVTVQFEEE